MVNINELIENTLNMRNYVLKTNNINVNIQYDKEMPLIAIDPGQIQQVFLNLVINAEYAMKKSGRPGQLNIVTEKSGKRCVYRLQIIWPGISPEIIRKLFQPFFTTKPVGEGTGLGLSLSRAIITEHGVLSQSQAN